MTDTPRTDAANDITVHGYPSPGESVALDDVEVVRQALADLMWERKAGTASRANDALDRLTDRLRRAEESLL